MRIMVHNHEIFASTGGREFDPTGPVLLFIHGSGQSHLTWVLQGRFFANRGWQVLAPDLPGHYLSGGNALSSIELMADWCADLLTSAGVKTAAIIGHSQGGLVALELARRYPQRVTKLAIIASAMAIPVHDSLLDMATNTEEKAATAMVAWGHDAIGHAHDHTMPGQSHLGYGEKVMGQNPTGVLLTDLTACNQYKDGEVAAKAVACPSICILAERDKMTPAKFGKALGDVLPDNQTHIINGAGHFVHSEKPVETNMLLRSFLTKSS